ncbi:hypothetical protein NW762_001603 [Fusarium torreyae]|uniref:Xylanolytic transcriptional activator regulatory domain-containing protein n=1 Tax=Fusarium torreyae TaxID=1237075 RepID=A0A9W8VLP8_9HYPO|nr:hypothetical protein NW762_001603 [Fusarium torreyae]
METQSSPHMTVTPHRQDIDIVDGASPVTHESQDEQQQHPRPEAADNTSRVPSNAQLSVVGESCSRLDANDELFNKASTSFDRDRESSRIDMILSSYLLHYWFGNPAAYRDVHWWLAAAIRSAQCMGYHRSTSNAQMPPQEKSRWKRIWWCLYIRDRQVSISTGTPMAINDLDHDVEELTVQDFPDEAPETAQYIISQVELNKTVARLYFLHCSPSRLHLSRDSTVRQKAMQDIHTSMQSWLDSSQAVSMSNGNHHLSLTLKVCYHYYLINLYQRLQRQSKETKETKPILHSATQVFTLVENSLLYWTPMHFPMIYVSALFSAMMALAADGSTSPPKSDQLLCKIRPGLLALKQFEPTYILARWIRNFFMDIINRSESSPEEIIRQSQTAADEVDSRMTPSEREPRGIATSRENQMKTPISLDQPNYFTPNLGVDDANLMFDTDTRGDGCHSGGLNQGMSNYPPAYFTNGVFSYTHSGDAMDFPQPDSSQYQALYFLADLGIASSDLV